MAIVTPTDRPKLVRNRCVIEVFGGVFVFSRCFLDFSVGVGAFVIGLSQISSFFTCKVMENPCAKFTPFDPQIEILQIFSNFSRFLPKN